MDMVNRNELDEHLIFMALKVNGVTLPGEHGFPVRVVWVKWIDYIEIY